MTDDFLMDDDAGIVHDEDWPGGLRCLDCKEDMLDGTAYVSYVIRVRRDGIKICEILCPSCAVIRAITGKKSRRLLKHKFREWLGINYLESED